MILNNQKQICVNYKQEGTQNTALWHPRNYIYELTVTPINNNTLPSTTQEMLNHRQHAATQANGPQLIEKANMANYQMQHGSPIEQALPLVLKSRAACRW
jgi:hypothetical protein